MKIILYYTSLILILVGYTNNCKAESDWSIRDIRPANGSIMTYDYGGLIGIELILVFSDEANAPDSVVITNFSPTYSDLQIDISYRSTGSSPIVDSGMGGKMKSFYFTIEYGANFTVTTEWVLGGSFDIYHQGVTSYKKCAFSYIIKQLTLLLNAGHIDGAQTIRHGTRPSTIIGSDAISYNRGTRPILYTWYKDDGAGWVIIDNAWQKSYSPEALTKPTQYKRLATDGIAYAESNVVTVSLLPPLGYAVENMNAIIKSIPREKITSIDLIALSNSIVNINYHDGLGRSIQSIDVGGAPNLSDIIMPSEYNIHDKSQGKEFLPYVSVETKENGIYDKSYNENQNHFYVATYGISSSDAYAYYSNIYESSAQGRIIKTTQPEEEFRVMNRSIQYDYSANQENEVLKLRAEPSSVYVLGWCPKSTLHKVTKVDEDNSVIETFYDALDNLVLERKYISEHKSLNTYYIYNENNKLVCVIPPIGAEQIINTDAILDDAFLSKYCYRYSYDYLGIITTKSIPQRKSMFYVNNAAGLPIMESRWANDDDNAFYAYEYDAFNRLKKKIFAHVQVGPTTNPDNPVLTEQIQADYIYDVYPTNRMMFVANNLVSTADERTKGLKTYERLFILDTLAKFQHQSTSKMVERTYYYDYKGRVIQIAERNHLGGVSRYSTKYDFVGNVLVTLESHVVNGNTATLETTNTYDHRNRLLSTTAKLNDRAPAEMTFTYNELGQLSGKRYGVETGMIVDTLKYNIRGLLTEQENALFDAKLRYYNPQYATPSYTGNITEWEWKHKGGEITTPVQNTYAFTYDPLSRLTDTKQHIGVQLEDRFVERGIDYDIMGNIKSLTRIENSAVADNLLYVYNGNQLIEENNLTQSTSSQFTYDSNGSMISDSGRDLHIDYNLLDLVSKVTNLTQTQMKAQYLYTSEGVKLSVKDANGHGYDYLGSLIYVRDGNALTLESAAFGGGRIIVSQSTAGTTYEPNYFLTDHLGSVRVVVGADGDVKERNDYYAYGKRHPNPDLVVSTNRYGFSGKESQTTGDLGYLDFGARMYNHRQGRWTGMDLLAEKYPSVSPYAYCAGNPISRIDPNGMDWYFGLDGSFFGNDELKSDMIRIIDKSVWELNKGDGGIISSKIGHESSAFFSKAGLSDKASLNVYQHFNMTGQKLRAGDGANMSLEVIFNKIGNHEMDISEYEFNRVESLYINLEKNRDDGISDHANNIINTFEHEYKHLIDAQKCPNEYVMNGVKWRETRAIDYQMSTPTFKLTSPTYQNATHLYKNRFK